MSFPGQDCDAAGQLALANGCTSVGSAAGGSSATSDASTKDESMIEGLLPNAGGFVWDCSWPVSH